MRITDYTAKETDLRERFEEAVDMAAQGHRIRIDLRPHEYDILASWYGWNLYKYPEAHVTYRNVEVFAYPHR